MASKFQRELGWDGAPRSTTGPSPMERRRRAVTNEDGGDKPLSPRSGAALGIFIVSSQFTVLASTVVEERCYFIKCHKQAMQYSKCIPGQTTSNARSSVSTTGWSPSTNSSNLMADCEWGVDSLTGHSDISCIVVYFYVTLANNSFSFALLSQVKIKIALCHSALHECRQALQELSGLLCQI